MNQDDFRQLLAKSSSNSTQLKEETRKKRHGSNLDMNEIRKLCVKKTKKDKQALKFTKHAKSHTTIDENDKSTNTITNKNKPSYRDRAAERRAGNLSSDMINANEFVHLNVEQSKYLGGDFEHTHLVKGLDFALLSQLKREKDKLQQQKDAMDQQYHEKTHHSSNENSIVFKSRLASMIYTHACSQPVARKKITPSDLFLLGRMYYTFNITSNNNSAIPMVIQRSAEDCPDPDDVVNGATTNQSNMQLIELMGDAIKRIKAGKSHRKKTFKDKEESIVVQEINPTSEILSEDEDIFPDAGDYIPVDQREQELKNINAGNRQSIHEKSSRKGEYFTDTLNEIDEINEKAEQWKAAMKMAMAKRAKVEKESIQRDAKNSATIEKDSYTECYPEYQSNVRVDSEDEEEDGDGRRKASKQ